MTDSPADRPAGPLAGVRIVDLTTVILGTFATQILGDLGADVIKIETPGGPAVGGDIMRWGGRSPSGPESGMGPLFMTYNRNKRSVMLDLKSPGGQRAARRLIEGADVFASNVRMDAMKRMNLGYDDVAATKPDIVYVHAVGFGSEGPYGGLPAYDELVQAAGGGADLLPRADGNPAPRYFPALVGDKTVGLYMVYATLAGLYQKAQTGRGQFIEVPMLECYTHYTMSENLYGHVFDPPTGDFGYGRILNPDRRPYRTADGYIGIAPYSDRHWRDFFALGNRLADFDTDPRFNTYAARIANIKALYAMVESITILKTTAEWLALLHERSIPAMPVNRLDQVMDDEHLKAVGMFMPATHPSEGPYVDIRHPVSFSGAATPTRRHPPRLGENTADVLREAGFDDDDIAELSREGAFGDALE
jgi:crotonobetainyl-CoA:carnitine CoA-transferase CaiB-like acyl-CoA transferase